MSREKEPNFFLWHYDRGLDWWRSQFKPGARVRGESSTDYTLHPLAPGVPERIHGSLRGPRFIYLVRDPVDRLVAQYLHNVSKGIERRPPEGVFRHPQLGEADLVYRGLYASQLERYLRLFPRDRILVLEQDELRDDRERTLKRVFAFLDVDEDFRSPAFRDVHHRSDVKRRPVALARPGGPLSRALRRPGDRRFQGGIARSLTRPLEPPDLDPATRGHLASFFRTDASRLRELTGLELPHWCV